MSLGEIKLFRYGRDLFIKPLIGSASSQNIIYIKDQFANGSSFEITGIEKIIFANGEQWDTQEIGKQLMTASDQEDTLFGTDNNDTLNGLGGDDTLTGSAGDDIYVFTGSWGKDTISDTNGSNIISFGNEIQSL